MEGIIPGHVEVVGVSADAGGAREADLDRGLLGRHTVLAWAEGARSHVGAGIAAQLVAADGGALLAAVERASVSRPVSVLAPPAPWFGGFAFDPRAPVDRWWEGFPAARAVVPELLLSREDGSAELTAFVRVGAEGRAAAEAQARDLLARALAALRTGDDARNAAPAATLPAGGVPDAALAGPAGRPAPRGACRVHAGDREAWDALVSGALGAFESGTLRKVVLARPIDVSCASPWDVAEVRAAIRAAAGPAVAYEASAPDGTVFFGASPERLFLLRAGQLETQALASSAAPGEIERLTAGLKEAREHAAVVEGIRAALEPLSTSVQIAPAPEPLGLGYVAHLRTPVRARLRSGVTPSDVVRALHPTAAVGGTPGEAALAFLRRHEHLARGWYAGGIGWMGPDSADLRVALRCALLRGPSARLFSGAGAVAGSTAEGEWRETALKARFMLRALGAEAEGSR